MKWTIDGLEREALVAIPKAKSEVPAPLVFVLHGRNNYVDGTLKFFSLHPLWPEAVVVYPQGLVLSSPAPKRADGKSKSGTGWQVLTDQEGGRDLKFSTRC